MVRCARLACAVALLAAIALLCSPGLRQGHAAVPTQMIYQGFLTDILGAPLHGAFDMRFDLFADSTGGPALWSESYAGVAVEAGTFGVVLGSVTPLSTSLFAGSRLWLETTVNDTTLSPRRPLASVPYALRTAIADSALRVSGSGDTLWSSSGGSVYRASGNVGIGSSSPSHQLTIQRTDSDFSNSFPGPVRILQSGTGAIGIQLTGGSPLSDWNIYRGWQGDLRIGNTALGDHFRMSLGGFTYLGYPGGGGTRLNGPTQFNADLQRGLAAVRNPGATDDYFGLEQISPAQSGDGRPALRLFMGSSEDAYMGFGRYAAGPTFTEHMRLTQSGNLGLGTATPTSRLEVAGTIQSDALKIPTGAVGGYVLTSDASGLGTWQPPAASGMGGSGAVNTLPVFAGPTTLASSVVSQISGDVGVGGGPSARLHAFGQSPGVPVLIASGASGQTANLQEWRTALGSTVASVSASGVFGGSGASLTGLNAANVTTGNLVAGRLPQGGTWSLSAALGISGGFGVGVGTSTPQSRLHVLPVSPGARGLIVQGQPGQVSSLQEWQSSSGTLGFVGPTGVLQFAGGLLHVDPGTSRVGVGTSTPQQRLDVVGTVRATGLQLPVGAVPGYVLTGDGAGIATWQPSPGGSLGSSIESSEITDGTIVDADVSPAAGIQGTKISANFGSQDVVTAGRLGVGTGSPTKLLTLATSEVDYDITTVGIGNLDITTAAGNGGTISISSRENSSFGITVSTSNNVGIAAPNPSNILTVQQNSATDPIADGWGTYSSRRWKENIEPITDPLAKVRKLRGVTFDWKQSGRRDLGMIAEEVGLVVPEAVALEDDGANARSIDYGRLTALLVEAVKALSAETEVLRRRVESLTAAQALLAPR